MKRYYDVLFTVHDINNPSDAIYRVVTIEAGSLDEAVRWGKRQQNKIYRGVNNWMATQRFWTAGKAGELDGFIGRYVGQFIREARELGAGGE